MCSTVGQQDVPSSGQESAGSAVIQVTTLGGEVVTQFEISRSATIAEIKERIYSETSVSVKQQRLARGATVLEDGVTLQDSCTDVSAQDENVILLNLVQIRTKHILSAGLDGGLKVWDLDDTNKLGDVRLLPPPPDITSDVTCIVADWNRYSALSGSKDGCLRLWDLDSGEVTHVLSGHESEVMSLHVSNDGKRAWSRDVHGECRDWDLTNLTCVKVVASQGRDFPNVSIIDLNSPQQFGMTAFRHTVYLWAINHSCHHAYKLGSTKHVTALTVDWVSSYALAGDQAGTVIIWTFLADLDTWVPKYEPTPPSFIRRCKSHTRAITSVALCWRERRCLSTSKDCTLQVWELDDFSVISILSGDTAITCLSVCWASNFAVTGHDDGVLSLWDLQDHILAKRMKNHGTSVTCVSLCWS